MKILGIDPGIARLGWGVILKHNSILTSQAYGCFTSPLDLPESSRLFKLHQYLLEIFIKYSPDAVAVESLFFAKNAKTAIAVGQARGVILLATAQNQTQISSYTPLQVKQTLTGDGHADKKQIAHMVVRLLKLPSIPEPDDVTDALAIAITHAAMYKMKTATNL